MSVNSRTSEASGNPECFKLTAVHCLQMSGRAEICDRHFKPAMIWRSLSTSTPWLSGRSHGHMMPSLLTWPYELSHCLLWMSERRARHSRCSITVRQLLSLFYFSWKTCTCTKLSADVLLFYRTLVFQTTSRFSGWSSSHVCFFPCCTYLWTCIWNWFPSTVFHHSSGLSCYQCSPPSVFYPFLLFTSLLHCCLQCHSSAFLV